MFKFNPLTGKLDLVGGGDTVVQATTDETTFITTLQLMASAELTVSGESSFRIIDGLASVVQTFIQSITISSSGEMTIGNSSSIEVIQ